MSSRPVERRDVSERRRHPLEVLAAFAKLGVTSFGGPVAHIGYFRAELVVRRRWVTEGEFGDLLALCQFLPGPASSQLGFALGYLRGGPLGAVFAFLAFTLPSAILLVAFASVSALLHNAWATAVIGGLLVAAVAVVAQAVVGMARTLTPDLRRILIAIVTLVLALLLPGAFGQIGGILVGIAAGLLFCRATDATPGEPTAVGIPRAVGLVSLALFALVLVGGPLVFVLTRLEPVAVFDGFYRSGALVFGGGHVVLPLLQSAVVDPGWVTQQRFLEGYGAAQAVPGPLFTFAAYLGTALSVAPNGIPGALLALVGIFLPGFLLLIGVLPFWDRLRSRPLVRAGMRGANAAVVGILAAALITPVIPAAITSVPGAILAIVCFALLTFARVPAWAVVLIGGGGGLGVAAITGAL